MADLKDHWNSIYTDTETKKLGWYEADPSASLELIGLSGIGKDARILDVGSGASTLVGWLLKNDFKDIAVTDISEAAFLRQQQLLGKAADSIEWIQGDLRKADDFKKVKPVDLWHDRAVLHFLTSEEDRQAYVSIVKSLVKQGGFVIIAAFALSGAQFCSGLPVRNYNAEMLEHLLGDDFTLLKDFAYTYTMPLGDTRDYIYTLFKRNK